MRYQCVQCNEAFSFDDDAERPRCPKCLRQHGLRKLDESLAPAAGRKRGTPLPLVLLLLAAGAGGVYLFLAHGIHRSAPALLADQLRTAGVDAGNLVQLTAADDSVTLFAQQAVRSADKPEDKARAIVAALAARAQKQAFSRWPMVDTRALPDAAPLSAKETLAAIQKDGARAELYPLEVTALAVAALRSVDVPALVIEVFRYDGERAPLDPSGRFGYYALALPRSDGKPVATFDPYGARSLAPKPADFVTLSDLQVMAAALSLRGLHRVSNASESAGALVDAEAAVKLAPSSATVRSARAALMIASGGTEEGARELEAAAQLRPDPARRNNVAVLALAKGDADRAAKEVAMALQEAPDFASAHLTLASVHLARGETELARSELAKADSLEPNLAAVALSWAEFYASTGELAQAIAKGEQGVRLRPNNPETHLVLARVYRSASRFDDMRAQARKVLELASAADKERIKTLLLQVLGPTALEQPSGDSDALHLPSPQAGAVEPPSGGSGLQLGEPRLRLGGDSDKLKLKLQP